MGQGKKKGWWENVLGPNKGGGGGGVWRFGAEHPL